MSNENKQDSKLIKLKLNCNIDIFDKFNIKIDHNGISFNTKNPKEELTIRDKNIKKLTGDILEKENNNTDEK